MQLELVRFQRPQRVLLAPSSADHAELAMWWSPGDTGRLRTFAIAVVAVAGQRYIVQAFPKAAWVVNARAADQVTLTRGRRSIPARLVELPVEDRRPVLHRLVEESPASVGKRYADNGLSPSAAPQDVAASAERIAVFRVEAV
ncbi:nitroreductase family deazaflavin-dependent oxidoreductase [Nocardia sp. NPDC003963]